MCFKWLNECEKKRKLISPWKLHVSRDSRVWIHFGLRFFFFFASSKQTPKNCKPFTVKSNTSAMFFFHFNFSFLFSLQSLFMVGYIGYAATVAFRVLITFSASSINIFLLNFIFVLGLTTGDACTINTTPTGRRRMVKTTCWRFGGETFHRNFSGIQISRSWTITR